jgi:hypothetical protein
MAHKKGESHVGPGNPAATVCDTNELRSVSVSTLLTQPWSVTQVCPPLASLQQSAAHPGLTHLAWENTRRVSTLHTLTTPSASLQHLE